MKTTTVTYHLSPISHHPTPITQHPSPNTHPTMSRNPRHQLFVGIHNSVVAIDTRTGEELWRQKIGGSFVSVLWDGEQLFGSAKGQIFCLDPRDGAILWNNPLKGLGMGLVAMASSRTPSGGELSGIEFQRRAQAAAAAGAAAAS
jgi:outer membrane protein assembly factor BamB